MAAAAAFARWVQQQGGPGESGGALGPWEVRVLGEVPASGEARGEYLRESPWVSRESSWKLLVCAIAPLRRKRGGGGGGPRRKCVLAFSLPIARRDVCLEVLWEPNFFGRRGPVVSLGALRHLRPLRSRVPAAVRERPWEDELFPLPWTAALLTRLWGRSALGQWEGSDTPWRLRRLVAEAKTELGPPESVRRWGETLSHLAEAGDWVGLWWASLNVRRPLEDVLRARRAQGPTWLGSVLWVCAHHPPPPREWAEWVLGWFAGSRRWEGAELDEDDDDFRARLEQLARDLGAWWLPRAQLLARGDRLACPLGTVGDDAAEARATPLAWASHAEAPVEVLPGDRVVLRGQRRLVRLLGKALCKVTGEPEGEAGPWKRAPVYPPEPHDWTRGVWERGGIRGVLVPGSRADPCEEPLLALRLVGLLQRAQVVRGKGGGLVEPVLVYPLGAEQALWPPERQVQLRGGGSPEVAQWRCLRAVRGEGRWAATAPGTAHERALGGLGPNSVVVVVGCWAGSTAWWVWFLRALRAAGAGARALLVGNDGRGGGLAPWLWGGPGRPWLQVAAAVGARAPPPLLLGAEGGEEKKLKTAPKRLEVALGELPALWASWVESREPLRRRGRLLAVLDPPGLAGWLRKELRWPPKPWEVRGEEEGPRKKRKCGPVAAAELELDGGGGEGVVFLPRGWLGLTRGQSFEAVVHIRASEDDTAGPAGPWFRWGYRDVEEWVVFPQS